MLFANAQAGIGFVSSATVASLEVSPGELKTKNLNLVINSNSQFCKGTMQILSHGETNVSASVYLFLFRRWTHYEQSSAEYFI